LCVGLISLIAAHIFSLALPNVSLNLNDLSSRYNYLLSKKSVCAFKPVAIVIDEYSLNNIPVRWPWKRALYASLLNKLNQEQVNTVGMDLFFQGQSEEAGDDQILADTLKNISTRVVLGYVFDYKKKEPIFPFEPLRQASFSVGMINTPTDKDGLVRRLRGYVENDSTRYNSFCVEIAASFLSLKPQEIINILPLLKDKSFFVNYQVKSQDIITVSFYDVLENLGKLKEKFGKNFLKGKLVLVYPDAAIHHDAYFTPIGSLAGGLLHLNGVANIVSGHFFKEFDLIFIPLLLLSLLVIAYILIRCGFISGLLLLCGITFIQFWFDVLLKLNGLKFDYAGIIIFSFLFFVLGTIYKYLVFLTQLFKIKDKATLDPLRGIFTLRYFYYRLDLELKNRYLFNGQFLVFVRVKGLKEALIGMSMLEIKDLWQKMQAVIYAGKSSFWSVYSEEEIVGCLVTKPARIEGVVNSLRNNLGAIFREKNIEANPQAAYLKLNRDYSVRELPFVVAQELNNKKEKVVMFKESDLANLKTTSFKTKESGQILDTLSEDIEEKNRQLLSLIGDLNKEHSRTKEAFFQIISSLANALEARDPYTEGHSQRVADYSLRLAEGLKWSKEEKEKLEKAALLHDLGKIGIPDAILHKKSSLNEEEFAYIKKHSSMSAKILEPLKDFKEILPWIMYHHEKWDGTGYPHGLVGNAIPLASQIITIADVFDALTTGRDYKVGFSYDYAIGELIKGKGTHFNPELVDAFIKLIKEPEQK